jgi:hypothetical protein
MAYATFLVDVGIAHPQPAATQLALGEVEVEVEVEDRELEVEVEEEWATQVATPKPPTDDVQVKIA